jgi:uncharacterized membrane protein
MRVLVIGATGLIGSAVVARLIGAGHRVRALARHTAQARRSQPTAEWVSFEPLPRAYHRLFRTWFAFGFPAFAAVLAIFWLMISRPAIAALTF